MRIAYLALVALIVLNAAAYGVWIDTKWVTDWTAELGAGLLASLVIIALVDRALDRRREQEQQRVRAVALSQLRTPLARHLSLLCNWYKGTLPARPEPGPSSFEEVFQDGFFEQVRSLDFSVPAPILPAGSRFDYSEREMSYLREGLERVIDKYATFLDASMIELLQRLADSPLVRLFRLLAQSAVPLRGQIVLFREESNTVRDHVLLVLKFLSDFNAASPESISFEALNLWNDATGHKIGGLRVGGSDKCCYALRSWPTVL